MINLETKMNKISTKMAETCYFPYIFVVYKTQKPNAILAFINHKKKTRNSNNRMSRLFAVQNNIQCLHISGGCRGKPKKFYHTLQNTQGVALLGDPNSKHYGRQVAAPTENFAMDLQTHYT